MLERAFSNVDPRLDHEGHAWLQGAISLPDIVNVHADPVTGAMGVPDSILFSGGVGNETELEETLLHDLDRFQMDGGEIAARRRHLHPCLLSGEHDAVDISLQGVEGSVDGV